MGPTLERLDAAWLSGLLDGEGCFDAPRGNPRVRVKMSDFDIILRAAHLMDAKTHPETIPGRKPLLVAQVTGARAVAVLREILPFLGSRRTARATEIIVAFEFRDAKPRNVIRMVKEEAA